MAMVYAATYPERVARTRALQPGRQGQFARRTIRGSPLGRGERALGSRTSAPAGERASSRPTTCACSRADASPPTSRCRSGGHASMRLGASPGAAVVIARMAAAVDVRDVLPSIRVPTLVACHRARCGAKPSTSPSGSPAPGSSRSAARDALFWEADGLAEEVVLLRRGAVGRSRARDRARDRSCSPTSWARLTEAVELGDRAWADLVQPSPRGRPRARWIASAAGSSTRPATASSRPSTARSARSAAPPRSGTACGSSASRFAPDCTPASAKWSGRSSPESRSTSGRAGGLAGQCGRGSRLLDRQGSRRGLGPRIRRSRRAQAQGHSRRVAALRGRELNL